MPSYIFSLSCFNNTEAKASYDNNGEQIELSFRFKQQWKSSFQFLSILAAHYDMFLNYCIMIWDDRVGCCGSFQVS